MTTRGGGRREKGGGGVAWKAPEYPSSRGRGPGLTTAMEWRRLGLSPFWENPLDMETKTGRFQDLEENLGGTRKGHRYAEGPETGEPPRVRQRPGSRPRAAKGGSNRHGNAIRCRHAARGAGTRGAGNVQVGGASNRERRWGEGENREGFQEEWLRIGRR